MEEKDGKEETQETEIKDAEGIKERKEETQNNEVKEVEGLQEAKDEKKKRSNETKETLLRVLVVIGPIIGALIAYFATTGSAKINANAEITKVMILIQTTQTAAAQATPMTMKMAESPTPAPTVIPEPGLLEIEQIPQHVFVFAGNNNPDGGYGTFDLIYEEKAHPVYQMTYSLPSNKYGYAGMVFQFPDGVDLSAFREIEFTLLFQHPGDKIELYVRDIAGHNNTVLIGGNGQDAMKLHYEFTNFPDINVNAVKEIGWIASTDYAKGDHQVQVMDVRLVKHDDLGRSSTGVYLR